MLKHYLLGVWLLARWNSFVEGRTGPFMFHVNFPLLYLDSGHETPPGFWDKACEFLADR